MSQLDGSIPADLHNFFFVFQKVSNSGKSDEESSSDFLRYLDGEPFEFSSQAFVKNANVNSDVSDYQKVKKALFERFASVESPKDVTRDAMGARISFCDLNRSLRNLHRLNEKAGFYDEANFG